MNIGRPLKFFVETQCNENTLARQNLILRNFFTCYKGNGNTEWRSYLKIINSVLADGLVEYQRIINENCQPVEQCPQRIFDDIVSKQEAWKSAIHLVLTVINFDLDVTPGFHGERG